MPAVPRRILILSIFFTEGHGGTPESVLLLARALRQSGILCDVLCRKGLCRDAASLERLPAGDGDGWFTPALPDIASYQGILVAGSWNRQAPKIVLRAVLAGVPVVYTAKGCLCGVEFRRLRDMRRIPYLLLVEWLLLVLARHVVFTSDVERRAFLIPSLAWRHKAQVIPEPFEGAGQAQPVSREGVTVGFMAEISPRKGLYELIAGFAEFLVSRPGSKVRLKIVGAARKGSEAYLRECRALASSSGAEASMDWCGPIRGEARDGFYASLDLFVCPSQFESFGLTPLEALWQGTPACAGPAIGVLEFLKPHVPVIRLASLQSAVIAKAFCEFLDNRPEASQWKGRAACETSNAEIGEAYGRLLAPPPQAA